MTTSSTNTGSGQPAVANEKFRQHVTSVSFNLTLKRTMIEALQFIRHLQQAHERGERGDWARSPALYVTGFWACERRGLVESLNTTGDDGMHDFSKLSARLTPAGEHVWQLLLLSGLVFDIVEREVAA